MNHMLLNFRFKTQGWNRLFQLQAISFMIKLNDCQRAVYKLFISSFLFMSKVLLYAPFSCVTLVSYNCKTKFFRLILTLLWLSCLVNLKLMVMQHLTIADALWIFVWIVKFTTLILRKSNVGHIRKAMLVFMMQKDASLYSEGSLSYSKWFWRK